METINLENVAFDTVDILSIENTKNVTMDIEVAGTHYYTLGTGEVSHNSVSTLTQTTSGIEPAFMLKYTRRRKITHSENVEADFIDDMGDKWVEYDVYHHGVKQWMEATGLTDIEQSPYFGATANDLDWKQRVKIQAAAQKWIDHSISSCVSKDTLFETDRGLLYYDEIVDINNTNEGFKEYIGNISLKTESGEFIMPDYIFNNGIKDTLEIEFSEGSVLNCTENELLRCIIGDRLVWVRADELEEGDVIFRR